MQLHLSLLKGLMQRCNIFLKIGLKFSVVEKLAVVGQLD
jgi:hypothetical protein